MFIFQYLRMFIKQFKILYLFADILYENSRPVTQPNPCLPTWPSPNHSSYARDACGFRTRTRNLTFMPTYKIIPPTQTTSLFEPIKSPLGTLHNAWDCEINMVYLHFPFFVIYDALSFLGKLQSTLLELNNHLKKLILQARNISFNQP